MLLFGKMIGTVTFLSVQTILFSTGRELSNSCHHLNAGHQFSTGGCPWRSSVKYSVTQQWICCHMRSAALPEEGDRANNLACHIRTARGRLFERNDETDDGFVRGAAQEWITAGVKSGSSVIYQQKRVSCRGKDSISGTHIQKNKFPDFIARRSRRQCSGKQ
jgi:hypothetical protein